MSNPFVPGVEVIVVYRFSTRMLGRRTKVRKCYKNGNFVLEGSSEQWRAGTSTLGEKWTAWRTGSARFGPKHHLEIYTEAHERELTEQKRKQRLRAFGEEFSRWLEQHASKLSEEQEQALRKMMEGEKKCSDDSCPSG